LIDIALHDKMIAIEINGNWHYERNGQLKPYFQERHHLLEQNGWEVYEVHYSACFNLEKWKEFFIKINNSEIKVEFDYFNYTPREAKYGHNNCICGKKKLKVSKLCNTCNRHLPKARTSKIIRPSKEDLEKLVWEKPSTHIANDFKVSGSAINKWCKEYGISKPPRGYWTKIKFLK